MKVEQKVGPKLQSSVKIITYTFKSHFKSHLPREHPSHTASSKPTFSEWVIWASDLVRNHDTWFYGGCHLEKDSSKAICPSVPIFYVPILRNYTWYLFHIFRTDQYCMELLQLVGYFDLLIFSLENMTFTLKFMFWPLPLYPETINSNCFILSGYINLPGDLCTVGLFWPFDLWTSHYDSYIENLDDLHHSNLVQVSTQKLYMIAVSYFQDKSILYTTCTLSDYFDLLSFHLENMTFTLTLCSDHYILTIIGNCFIFTGHIHLPWELCTAGLFWPWYHNYLENIVLVSGWQL